MLSSLLLPIRFSTLVLGLMLSFICPMMSGCESVGPKTVGQKGLVQPNHVRVMHSELHCRAVDKAASSPLNNADHVETIVYGASFLLSLYGSEWEWKARQIAVERDADLSLIRPCDGDGSFKFAQIEIWRSRDFAPPVFQDEPLPESGTLMAPSNSTYGIRLQNIFDCFERARVTVGPIASENKQRLGNINATEFFTPGPTFEGYARIDKYYRPTRTGRLSLSGILLDRGQADWAAWTYQKLSLEEKTRFAERYLACLLDRGYGLRSTYDSNMAIQPTAKGGG